MAFWVQFAIWAVTTLIAYALQPKPKKQKPPTLDDFDVPTAEAGRPIPVVFGEVTVTGPNVVWYGDFEVETETKDGVKYRYYYIGFHMAICHGPVDYLQEILADKRHAWPDDSISYLDASGEIQITKKNLFGGKDREGGLKGYVDVMMGEPAQTTNAYLTQQQGTPQPAYRGVLSLVAKHMYVGTTTYVKPWSVKVRRIVAGWKGDNCWYPEKAPVGVTDLGDTYVLENFSNGLSLYTVAQGSMAPYSILNGRLLISNDDQNTVIERSIPSAMYSYVAAEFMITTRGANDVGSIYIYGPGWYFHVIPARTSVYDPDRLCRVISDSTSTTGSQLYGSALDLFVWHKVEAFIDHASGDAEITLSILNGATLGTFTLSGDVDGPLDTLQFHSSPDEDGIVLWDNIVYTGGGAADMNPSHMIYEAITSTEWGMGYDASVIDDTSFRDAADTFWTEGLGLSMQWMRQGPIEEFIQIVLDHAGAVLAIDPSTGKFLLRPIRGDYDVNTLPVYDESKIVDIPEFRRMGYGELTGEITVVYREKRSNTDQAITMQNLAVIQSQNGVVSEQLAFPGLSKHSTASRVCARELKQRSVPIATGKMRVNRQAWDLIPGDVFLLSWAKLGLSAVICRVIELDTGSLAAGMITVTFTEDVYGLPDSTYAVEQESGWTEPDYTASAAIYQTMLELPRWWLNGALGVAETDALPATAGYIYPLAVSPVATSTGHEIWSRIDVGSPDIDYTEAYVDGDWVATALVQSQDSPEADIPASSTTLYLASSTLTNALEGDLIQMGEGATAEIVRLTGGDLSTYITVTRGHLDTTPRVHPHNTRLYLLPSDRALRDPTQYSDGEIVDTKLLTMTTGDVLDIAAATAVSITLDSRADRPISAGNVKINDDYFPTTIYSVGSPESVSIAVTWAHRNKDTQTDTTLQIDTGITSEAGISYNVAIYDNDTEALLDSVTGVAGTSWTSTGVTGVHSARLELETRRDNGDSPTTYLTAWQKQIRYFDIVASISLAGIWTSAQDGTLSNGDKTVTQDSASINLYAIGELLPTTGKWYVEFDISDSGAMLIAVGMGTALTGGTYCAARSNAATSFVSAPITSATQATFTAGRIMFAIDFDSGKAWAGRNGTWFASGDPGAGTNPYYQNIPAASWRLFTHSDNDFNGVGTIVLHCAEATQNYSLPTGFSRLS